MAFSDEVVKDGRGRCHRIDVSFDAFATITYRWSDVAGVDASNDYDPRIISLSPLTRGFGQDHIFTVGSLDVVLGNEDEGADWLFETASVTNLYKMRAKLYVGLYDKATPSSIEWKQLGSFVFSDYPSRDDSMVRLSLSDDGAGLLEHFAERPTLDDWYAADSDPDTNPLRVGPDFYEALPRSTVFPLAFGHDEVEAFRLGIPQNPDTTSLIYAKTAFAVCCTTSTDAVAGTDIEEVWVEIDPTPNDGSAESAQPFVIQLPRTYELLDPFDDVSLKTLWTAYKSETISKGGKDWKVLWVGLHEENFKYFLYNVLGAGQLEPNTGLASIYEYDTEAQNISRLWVKGYPLSATTLKTTRYQPGYQVAADLISSYSRTTSAIIDTTTFNKVAASHAFLPACGMVGGPGDTRTLLQTLIDISASFDFDLGMSWGGALRFSAPLADFDSFIADFQTIDETRTKNVTERWPSRDQRGAAFNTVTLYDMRTSDLQGITAPSPGPFGSPSGSVEDWGREIRREFSCAWRPVADLLSNPWHYRGLDGRHRSIISFTTDLEALLLDLGDYFLFNWTRTLGDSDPYTDAVFQVEGIKYDPMTGVVEVEAIWRNDFYEFRPYLLDNETLLTRASGSGGRTATLVDGDGTVLFSSGNLVTDGVTAGDNLILKDSSESTALFKRNKVLRIDSVTYATHLEVSDPLDSLDFDAGAGVAVSAWEIRRSHVTYHTTASDAVNYPEGGNMYGRVANDSSAGGYSAAGTGNFTDGHILLEG